MRIPHISGRPMILFPEAWSRGWLHPDHKGVPNRDLKQWLEWRDMYYYLCTDDVFGRAPMFTFEDHIGSDKGCFSGEFGRPLAPWGLSTAGVPLLHPDDAVQYGLAANSVFVL